MKLVSYLSGIPPQNNNKEKPLILQYMVNGVNHVGDLGICHTGMNIVDCDVALLQGFTHPNGKDLPHLKLRTRVVEHQKAMGNRTLIADSNLFLYAKPDNLPHNYLRYSYDGVFKNTGFYFDKDIDPNRWRKLSTDLNIQLKDYRKNGEHILIPLQRNGGWSMRNLPVMEWLKKTIIDIRKFSDRPIVVRGHPGDKKVPLYLQLDEPDVTISPWKKPIVQDLQNAWAVVTYNSSPGVVSLIEGVPVFAMDPDPNYSQYHHVSNTTLKRLEDPKMFDRQDWIEALSMCHWKFEELRSGEAWEFMRNYVRQ